MRLRVKGFSLIEVVIATSITATIMYLLAMVIQSNANATHFDLATNDAASEARQLSRRISTELRNGGADDLGDYVVPDRTTGATVAVNSLVFRQRERLTDSTVAGADWGTQITYALQASPGETPGNGVDDDRDGLVDEQDLVRTQGTLSLAVATGVMAFDVTRDPGSDAVNIALTVARPYERAVNGTPASKTIRMTVRLHNRPTN